MLKEKTYCQVCDSTKLVSVMDLGPLPLPDQLLPVGDTATAPKYPTEVMWCDNCKTAHLRHVVDNKVVFPAEYHYRAKNTKDVLDGMEGLVESVEKMGSVRGLNVLDIGCNDGALLDAFKRRGAFTYGFEPTDAAKEAGEEHVVWQQYLDVEMARAFVDCNGHPDIITFVNVFAHIEDFPSVLRSLCVLLGPNTLLVVENHYMGSVLDRNQFDTFYHEHPRTYSYTSFLHIAHKLGFHVADAEFPARYGGNIRVFMKPGTEKWKVHENAVREQDFEARIRKLAHNVGNWQKNKRKQVMNAVGYDGVLPAAAMPGRATILFNLLSLNNDFIHGVYEVPRSKKIGYKVPGTDIPILSDATFPYEHWEGPVLNMAWHIPNEIEANWRKKGFRGEFIQAVDPGDFN